MPSFDPSGQLQVLSQALSNRSTAVGFMIGAGCPSSIRTEEGGPLIPATQELTELVAAKLRASALREEFEHIEAQYAADGIPLPNVEDLLTRIRSLREISGSREIDGLTAHDLANLDNAICAEIQERVRVPLPEGTTSYASFARWIHDAPRSNPVEIFTTNYDLLLEQALERERIPYFDGFAGANAPFFDVGAMELDRLPERWTRLWKIHGSINWRMQGDGIVRSNTGDAIPLIFPSNLKYAQSRRLPYLAMRDRLRDFVKNRSILVTCGYSFSDEHLNEDILFGLNSSAASVCYGLLFGSLDSYLTAKAMAGLRPNLNLLADDGAVLRGREVRWEEHEYLRLGDFAAFGDFLAQEVMGGTAR